MKPVARERALLQIEAVRRDGKTNMLDRKRVQAIAVAADLHELVILVDETSSNEWVDIIREATDKYRGVEDAVQDVLEEIPETVTIELELS